MLKRRCSRARLEIAALHLSTALHSLSHAAWILKASERDSLLGELTRLNDEIRGRLS